MKQKVKAMIWILRMFGDLIIYAKGVQSHRTSFYFKPTNTIANHGGSVYDISMEETQW